MLVIHDLDDYSLANKSELLIFGIEIPAGLKGNNIYLYDVASYSADAVLIIDKPGAKISSKLLNKTAFKDNKNKLTVFEQKDIENVDYNSVTKSLDQIISKLTSK